MNRQKFLAELAKLLSFMYEEDRRYALSMYERMFDIAGEDEQWLIQNLMSPTRQAVIIARSYNAKEKKLSVSAQWKDEDGYEDESDETPPFILTINKIFDDLFPEELPVEEEEEPEATDEDQVSFFEGGEEKKKPRKMPRANVLLSSTQEFSSAVTEAGDIVLSADENLERILAEEKAAIDFETETGPEIRVIDRAEVFDSSEDTVPDETKPEAAEETSEETSEETPEPSTENPIEVQPEEPSKEKPEDVSAETSKDPSEDAEKQEQGSDTDAGPKAETPVSAAKSIEAELGEHPWPPEEQLRTAQEKTQAPEKAPTPVEPPKEEPPVIRKPEPKPKQPEKVPTKRVMSIPLVVLFLIPAVPVTLALLVLLALLAAVCLGLSLGLIALGTVLILSAFSGFAVLADIMLLLGAAIVSMALGLLFLWLTFVLISEVMVGLVNAVRELAEKWCSKEVPAA